jgi:hypothetical protein
MRFKDFSSRADCSSINKLYFRVSLAWGHAPKSYPQCSSPSCRHLGLHHLPINQSRRAEIGSVALFLLLVRGARSCRFLEHCNSGADQLIVSICGPHHGSVEQSRTLSMRSVIFSGLLYFFFAKGINATTVRWNAHNRLVARNNMGVLYPVLFFLVFVLQSKGESLRYFHRAAGHLRNLTERCKSITAMGTFWLPVDWGYQNYFNGTPDQAVVSESLVLTLQSRAALRECRLYSLLWGP